jgi:hypothetical protein
MQMAVEGDSRHLRRLAIVFEIKLKEIKLKQEGKNNCILASVSQLLFVSFPN